MKKLIAVLMGLMMVFGLVACGDTGTSESDTTGAENSQNAASEESSTDGESEDASEDSSGETEDASEEAAGETEDASEEATGEAGNGETAEGGKTLVVYYSATGNTETAANYIAQATGDDLFELEPVEPYTEEDLNYSDDSSRVVYEHDNPDERNVELVADTVDNWEEYDTVFIGYPIWWGIAAWPVDDFIEANDFTGKTVIPFATSASSGLGESGTLLEEMAGTGNWLEGQRFSSRVSEEDVRTWLDGLNL